MDEIMQAQLNGPQSLRDVLDGLTNSPAAQAMRELERSAASAKYVLRSFRVPQDMFKDADRISSSMKTALDTFKAPAFSQMAMKMEKAIAAKTNFAKQIA